MERSQVCQDSGKKIVFDLGQTIDFKSIRYYVKETSLVSCVMQNLK